MKDSDQVCEQRLPDTKFEFMHEVNDHHPGNIEFLPRKFESLVEGILCKPGQGMGQLWMGNPLTIVGTEDVAFSRRSTRAPATAWPT